MIEYTCDNCHERADTLAGWMVVSVQFLRYDANIPTPPGGRVLEGMAPDLIFNKPECADAWCQKAGITRPKPVQPVGPFPPTGPSLPRL